MVVSTVNEDVCVEPVPNAVRVSVLCGVAPEPYAAVTLSEEPV